MEGHGHRSCPTHARQYREQKSDGAMSAVSLRRLFGKKGECSQLPGQNHFSLPTNPRPLGGEAPDFCVLRLPIFKDPSGPARLTILQSTAYWRHHPLGVGPFGHPLPSHGRQ